MNDSYKIRVFLLNVHVLLLFINAHFIPSKLIISINKINRSFNRNQMELINRGEVTKESFYNFSYNFSYLNIRYYVL